jgi:hypothetical protein
MPKIDYDACTIALLQRDLVQGRAAVDAVDWRIYVSAVV